MMRSPSLASAASRPSSRGFSRRSVPSAVAICAATAAVGVAACGSSSSDNGGGGGGGGASIPGGTLNGAGSTFVQPLVEEWSKSVSSSDGLTVNYTGNGSGAGQAQLING